MRLLLAAFLLCLGGSVGLHAQATGLGCIEEMLLPGYGTIASKARKPGTAVASVTVSKGTLASLSIQAPDSYLAREVEVFLRYNTTFRVDCGDAPVVLKFTFVLQGGPVADPTVRVRFRGPNEFVIESQPEAMRVEMGPDPQRPAQQRR
jgi:hypothetical protein